MRGVYDGFDVERSGKLTIDQLESFGSDVESLVRKMRDEGETTCDATGFLGHFNQVFPMHTALSPIASRPWRPRMLA